MNRKLLWKFISLGLVIIIILVPLNLIGFKISERSELQKHAQYDVASSWTGEQSVSGPLIAIPYVEVISVAVDNDAGFTYATKTQSRDRVRYVNPNSNRIEAKLNTETRKRGIYAFNVYTSALNFSGEFDAQQIKAVFEELKDKEAIESVGPAYLVIGVNDPRGLNQVSALGWGDKDLEMQPGAANLPVGNGIHTVIPAESYQKTTPIQFAFSAELRGMKRIQFHPGAKNTEVSMSANWAHPKFDGSFLPTSREISEDGFTANWRVSEFATGGSQAQVCDQSDCYNAQSAFGVELVDPVDIYLQSERASKYGFLFVILTFVGFIVFELLKKLRIHPVQYTLVGFSIAVFFLLIIALAEHIGFAMAYLLATIASLGSLFVYLQGVLGSSRSAQGFCAALAALYAILYMILKSEDFALLMGATLCFAVLAGVMMITRKLDWYALGKASDEA